MFLTNYFFSFNDRLKCKTLISIPDIPRSESSESFPRARTLSRCTVLRCCVRRILNSHVPIFHYLNLQSSWWLVGMIKLQLVLYGFMRFQVCNFRNYRLRLLYACARSCALTMSMPIGMTRDSHPATMLASLSLWHPNWEMMLPKKESATSRYLMVLERAYVA